MTNPDCGWLLDVTRLASRMGGGPFTGIDRVEAAWLRHLRDSGRALFLICRMRLGLAVMPRAAADMVLDWIDRPATAPDSRRSATDRLRAMAVLQGFRNGGPFDRLAKGVSRLLPAGGAYLNLGHTNATADILAALGRVPRLIRAVMIHDTIPLDFPQYVRAGTTERFLPFFASAMTQADAILCNSRAAEADIAAARNRLALSDRAPLITAHLGTDLVPADPCGPPAPIDPHRPRFLALGTIEPRKNHLLLLDAWQILMKSLPAVQMPQLVIIGRRGWASAALLQRLDLMAGPHIVEMNDLNDAQAAAAMDGAHGLLMPSHAEGFGMPMTEAAGRGVPVLSSPLAVAREILGDRVTVLPADDPQAWAGAVRRLSGGPAIRSARTEVPSWDTHFRIMTGALKGLHAKGVPA